MTVTAVLAAPTLAVVPGQSAATDVRVRNEGSEPVDLRLAVTGPARPYSWIVPDALSLAAGAEGAVRVGFHMPRAAVPAAGPLTFEVRITSGAAVAAVPGTVEVLPFAVLSALLSSPLAQGGDASGRYEVTLANRGNAPAQVVLRTEVPGDDVEVRVEPSVLVVDCGGSATAAVHVAGKGGPGRGQGSPEPARFRVVAEPEAGEPVMVAGEWTPAPARKRRGLVGGAVVAAVVVITGVVAVAAGGNKSPGGGTRVRAAAPVSEPGAPAAGSLDPCPAKGHSDTYGVRGLQPHEIATLPDTYAFLRVKADGCSPVRFNPCEPIHYIQNAAAAPPFAAENVREAFRRLARATGMTFVDDGLTDETARAGPYVPERYANRWAPILIVWEHFPAEQTTGMSQVFGQTVVYRVDDVVVSGRLRFNVDAYNDEFTKAPIEAGFGPPAGSGTGPIGRHNVQWGRIVLHELAHLVGLGHNRDFGSLMYPDAAQHASRPADFSRTDVEGLRYLGREAGCIPTPPVRPT